MERVKKKVTQKSIRYFELNTRSNFTFLTGASHPEELVAHAIAQGYRGIAITDECSFSGIVRAYSAAKKQPIKLLIGAYFRVDHQAKQGKDLSLILLCPNRLAYAQVSTLISKARRRCIKGEYRVELKDLAIYLDQVLAIWLPPISELLAFEQAEALKPMFKNRLWIGYHRLRRFDDFAHYQRCYELSTRFGWPMVAQGSVLMHDADRLALQHCLTAIRHNLSVQTLGQSLLSNAEQHLRDLSDIAQLYPSELIRQTELIGDRCTFSLDELRYEYPDEVVPKNSKAIDYLRSLCEEGMLKRWPEGVSDKTKKTLDHELSLIEELRYEHYFLTVYDIVAFARSQHILCQGRGSAANSVVCFCLMITEVDPEQSELLFERFISRERDEAPDIDVDFEHQRREEVIQYIYKKYSRERAALAATVITYRMKSAIRDVGKALGIDSAVVDHLAKSLAWWDKPDALTDYFASVKFADTALLATHYYQLVMAILGFPRHLSQHVGGFVITKSPIATLVPVENASMEERTVIQWDKYDIETLGLLKVDVLGLGMLTMIRKALSLTQRYCGLSDIAQIPKEDPLVYQMLCRGDSVGVFQVESRAQMSMLPRLKPQCFYDLVIEIAIVRPGPIQGDMVHPYLRRREGKDRISYPNPQIESVLKRTLGVPIFQEQVIKLAMVAANFSGGEADQLRRAMASWGRNGDLNKFRDKLVIGMLANGHTEDYAQRVFEQIKGFGSYGFPESHSASFAILAYFSAWLKRHHPAAFYCALLNSQPMGFYSPSQLMQDARRHRITVFAIDVDHSDWDSSLENIPEDHQQQQPAIRLGLHLVKGFNSSAAQRLVQARKERPFVNIQDLVVRSQLNKLERDALVQADTLVRLSRHRYQAQWQALAIEPHKPLLAEWDQSVDHDLNDQFELTEPHEVDNLLMDYQTTGLTLKRHPLAILRESYPVNRCQRAADLKAMSQGQFVRIAGVVTCRQRPSTAAGVLFLTLEDETGNMNIIVWKDKVERFRKPIMASKLLLIKGVVEREEKVVHVVAGHIRDISEQLAGFRRTSRDFH